MINHACPVLVLDDQKTELWHVTHGLASCGIPVMPHLVLNGSLECAPVEPYSGIRLLFTDLHILGPTQARPEQYTSALVSFIKKLIKPSTYLIVFWSNFEHEAQRAEELLTQRLDVSLKPIAFRALPKDLARNAADDDEAIAAPARIQLKQNLERILNEFPQLRALMDWESGVSQAAAETTNELLQLLPKGKAEISNREHVRAVMARMAQEALGHEAEHDPVKGLTQALMPILQDILEQDDIQDQTRLKEFLDIKNQRIPLPHDDLIPLLNDYFIHTENDGAGALERGAIIRFDENYLKDGLMQDIGLMECPGDWQEAVCREFYKGWGLKQQAIQAADKAVENAVEEKKPTTKALATKKTLTEEITAIKTSLNANNVYAVELSAICDHVQNKPRSNRFLFAIFVPTTPGSNPYYNKNTGAANEAIYTTPEITIGLARGRLLISCRIFIAKPFQTSIAGETVSRLRKDVVEELSHHYATHMRRPGKIAFF